MQVVLLRGVPGSGKTSLIKRLMENPRPNGLEDLPFFSTMLVVSTDKYFEVDGSYQFDASRLGSAHASCLRKFTEYVTVGADIFGKDHDQVLYVDNTNTSISEMAPYAALALAYGHALTIITLVCDPKTAWSRNTHGVPADRVFRMDQQLREDTARLPPYWSHRLLFV